MSLPRAASLVKGAGKFAVAAGDFVSGDLSGEVSSAPVDERVPEDRSANGKADEARYDCGHRQPLMDLFLILAPAEDDAANVAAAIPPGNGHNLLAVLTAIEPLDFPDIWLDASILKLLDHLHHKTRTQL